MIVLNPKEKEQLLTKFESYTEIPKLILAFIMLATLIIPLIVPLAPATHLTLEVIDWIIWAFFVFELSVGTYLSSNRLQYLKKNWLDILVVVLPLLRTIRILRVTKLLNTIRVFVLFGKLTNELKQILTRHYFHYLLVVLLGLIVISAILIFHFDNTNSAVISLENTLWLVVVNAVSGGFANVYPTTPEAKGISVLLILFGTVLVSYFTALLAAYFTEQEQDVEQERIERKLDKLTDEIRKLEKIEKEVISKKSSSIKTS